ncbi:phosphate starvation-inducible protein [Rhizobium phage P9VFCI]|uniref:Phosphate starvation-inducible protein PhoH n=3 Tax=Innesvirus TaxID=3044739 RepID=A0A076YKK2_9CAUD|nr:PhoH-like phosphate starvation-inducible [Rhizobium phage vB_RleM_P10VF]YP_010662091.1 PhoH-like phosphate starvation-inducible [Rhizobium phage P9VFCI]YP_010662278.1 PhoH-like phosphate starvation-inducible [Rhizobium phage AF3]AIK68307.1 phosphate starvation-inducible protein PhoH [Rhizobium phage vB_RleM_P10VF]QNH71414.1 phosphate starvation-inducible protein [Rhizobium phage AF3]QNH71831.1 phosphate starvation-inducible protein [Rhizobium phage P9VFCI]
MSKKPVPATDAATSSPLQKFISAQTSYHTRPSESKIVITARNEKQKRYLRSLHNNDVTIGYGAPGTGKTFLPAVTALDDLVNERVRKIVVIRPSVEVDGENDIGALPGDILGKYGPQVKPVTDTLVKYLGLSKLTQLLMNEVIEIVPIAFIRGRSFDNAWVLFDEAQNASQSAMKAILTRKGENCKIAISGDLGQSDRDRNNGLADLLSRLEAKPLPQFGLVQFGKDDIERDKDSPIIRDVLDLYEIDLTLV